MPMVPGGYTKHIFGVFTSGCCHRPSMVGGGAEHGVLPRLDHLKSSHFGCRHIVFLHGVFIGINDRTILRGPFKKKMMIRKQDLYIQIGNRHQENSIYLQFQNSVLIYPEFLLPLTQLAGYASLVKSCFTCQKIRQTASTTQVSPFFPIGFMACANVMLLWMEFFSFPNAQCMVYLPTFG